MAMTVGVVLHVTCGTVALASGATALAVKKGGPLHRTSGKVFFWSMVLMAITGIALALLPGVLITVLAGFLTLYMVSTSYLAVLKDTPLKRYGDYAAFALGLGVLAFGGYLSMRAVGGVTDSFGAYSVPAPVYFIFTSIVALGLAFDIKTFLAKKMSHKSKVMRHLWRMCVPLYVAASSFFEGQAQVFPEYLQGTIYLSLPGYAALLAMIYWLVKMRFNLRWPKQKATRS